MEENNNYENNENQNEQENQETNSEGISQVTDESSVKALCAVGYLYILFLLPLFLCKDNKFARHHTNQAILLFIGETIFGVTFGILSAIFSVVPVLGTLFTLVGLAVEILFLVVAILQIIAAVNMEEKEIPLIGKIRILK